MTTRESINRVIEDRDGARPIFRIMVFEHPCKEHVYPTGKHSGFPYLGASDEVGFYYDLDDAIRAMNENWGDIREYTYNAGFILCQFPGLYQSSGLDERMYFVWDEDKEGFFQQEEPEIFKHVAY